MEPTETLTDLYLQGLLTAYRCFEMGQLSIRIQGIECDVRDLPTKVCEIGTEVQKVKERINNHASFQMKTVREQALKVLCDARCATALNVEILTLFVSSIGSHITSIFFKGTRKNFKYSSRYRVVLYNTMSPDEILKHVGMLHGLSRITGGSISTRCIASGEDMKACALSIAAFVKIASLFDVEVCPISDILKSPNDQCILVRFEGRYSLSQFRSVRKEREEQKEVLRPMQKNVYILGPNGAGKSSWGNLISESRKFEVGIGTHTTMAPQSLDIEASYDFRLWDTPGLFDGSEQERQIQEHMKTQINYNGYCSAVIFIFNRSTPPNHGINDMLQFAIDNIGEFVKTNFIAILNDEGSYPQEIYPAYCERLDDKGFIITERNVIISNSKTISNPDVFFVRQKIGSFEPILVERHRKVYEEFINTKEDPKLAIRKLFQHGRREVLDILRQGKVSAIQHREYGSSDMNIVPSDIVKFQQNAHGYISGRLNVGKNSIKQEKSIKLRGGKEFINSITGKLNAEYTVAEADLFVSHILPKKKYILIHSPRGECNYELWDTSKMGVRDIQAIVTRHLLCY